MRMIRRVGWLVLLTAALWATGVGQSIPESNQPTESQVMQLMTAMGVQHDIDSSLQSTQNTMKLAARNSYLSKHPNADAETLKKLNEVFDSTPLFNFEGLSESLIPAYQHNLSADDVQAGIDFYTSDAGKRMLQKLPTIIKQANENGGQLVQHKLETYAEELQHKLEAFEADPNKPNVPEKPKSDDAKPKAADAKPVTADDKAKPAATQPVPADGKPQADGSNSK